MHTFIYLFSHSFTVYLFSFSFIVQLCIHQQRFVHYICTIFCVRLELVMLSSKDCKLHLDYLF